jgi:prevent-host-death family protein
MPIIKSSLELRNNYGELSSICHQTKNPVFITKNGSGDLAVMSIDLYESLTEKLQMYEELNTSKQDFRELKVRSPKGSFPEMETRL